MKIISTNSLISLISLILHVTNSQSFHLCHKPTQRNLCRNQDTLGLASIRVRSHPQNESIPSSSTTSSSILANDDDGDWITMKDGDERSQTHTKNKRIKLHIFQHPDTKIKLYGMGVSLSQFRQYILYIYPELNYNDNDDGHYDDDYDMKVRNIIQYVSTRHIDPTDPNVKTNLRELWFERVLIVDKTDLLTIYPSDLTSEENHQKSSNHEEQKYKRGGAYDMISSYSDRLLGVWREEMEQNKLKSSFCNNDTLTHQEAYFDLLEWLKQSYGEKEAQSLEWTTFHTIPIEEQRRLLQNFLNWFRGKFPYFYDKCNICHSSYKEEKDAAGNNHDFDDCIVEDLDEDDSQVNDDDELQGTFLGYIYPNQDELLGKATRTELYQCHVCHEYNRFPRFNSIRHIVTRRQGRCGEYSILLFRILRVLGHQVRWVVDWSDHVWTEIRLDNEWIHVDPCEAVLDKPLLYQEWGKVQTYIVAFWIPIEHTGLTTEWLFPSIEDVTTTYTTDALDAIEQRRDEDVISIIDIARQKMKIALKDMKL